MNPTQSASPSMEPSQGPTGQASSAPTTVPSIAPTTASAFVSSGVTLTLHNIEEEMSLSDVDLFEEVAKDFISKNLPNQQGVELRIDSVVLVEQTVIPSRRSLVSRLNTRRRVLHDAGLRVKLNVTGEVFPGAPPDDFSFEYAILFGFANEYSTFLSSLLQKSDFFLPTVTEKNIAEGISHHGNRNSNSTSKAVSTKGIVAIVVGALAALTLATIASVISLKRSYRNRLPPARWGALTTPNSSANGYDDMEEDALSESQSTVPNGHIDRYAAEGQPNEFSPTSMETGKAMFMSGIEDSTPAPPPGIKQPGGGRDPETLSVEMELSTLNPASTKSALFDGIVDSVIDDETLETHENVGINIPGLQACCTPQQMPSHPQSDNSIAEERNYRGLSSSQHSNSRTNSNYLATVPTLNMANVSTHQPMTPGSIATPGSVATASSGHLGARPMEATEEVQYRESTEDEAVAGRRVGLYDVFAPSGPLGIVVDTTPEGPVVHSMKPTSSLLGLVNPGDLVVGLDDMDTRAMSAATLTRLMAKRAQMPERKITLLAADS